MTQEEKAKAYDEAIERANNILKGKCKNVFVYNRYNQELIEEIFPELKESDDERIRKDIVTYLKSSLSNKKYGDKFIEDWIVWLEKQGEKINWKPSKDEMDALYGLAYITNKMDDKKDEAITKLYQDLKREFFNGSSYENMFSNTEDGVRRRSTIQVLEYARSLDAYNQYGKADIDKNIAWLEKQGEQKPTDKIEPIFNVGDKIQYSKGCGTIMTIEKIENGEYVFANNMGHTTIEDGNKWYLVEQKPTNKAEPKFKVGDYIISNNNSEIIYHITGTGINELGNSDYVCEHVGREKEYNGRIYNMSQDKVDANFRLWTIQDAKPGDVLTYSDSRNNVFVCIFKEYVNERVYDYCTLDNENFWEHGNWNYLASFRYTPATKEQREQLEKAMTDAGYTFDFEKKEVNNP